jgi:hypothetical protein
VSSRFHLKSPGDVPGDVEGGHMGTSPKCPAALVPIPARCAHLHHPRSARSAERGGLRFATTYLAYLSRSASRRLTLARKPRCARFHAIAAAAVRTSPCRTPWLLPVHTLRSHPRVALRGYVTKGSAMTRNTKTRKRRRSGRGNRHAAFIARYQQNCWYCAEECQQCQCVIYEDALVHIGCVFLMDADVKVYDRDGNRVTP